MTLAVLVDELDQPDSQAAEEAAIALRRLVSADISRVELVDLLSERVASYGPLGRAKAMEILKAIDDPVAAPSVAQLLLLPDEMTRWMATELVARWRYHPSVPTLVELRSRLHAERVPLEFMSQSVLRAALNVFGLRRPVVPSLLSDLPAFSEPTESFVRYRICDSRLILETLAEYRQGVLTISPWRSVGDQFYSVPSRAVSIPEYNWLFDTPPAWDEKVAILTRDRQVELDAIDERGADVYVDFDWISESDTFA